MTKTRTEGRNLRNGRTLASCCHLFTRTSHTQEERWLCQGAEPEGGGCWLLPAAFATAATRMLCPGCEVSLSSLQHQGGWKLLGMMGLL